MHDLRVACRGLVSTPIVGLIAILSLALGIGANAALFTLVNGRHSGRRAGSRAAVRF